MDQSNTLPLRVPGIVYCDGSDTNMGVTGKRKVVRCPVCNRRLLLAETFSYPPGFAPEFHNFRIPAHRAKGAR